MALSSRASPPTHHFPLDLHSFSHEFRSLLLNMKCWNRLLSVWSGHVVYLHLACSFVCLAIWLSLSWTWWSRSSLGWALEQLSFNFTLTSFSIENNSPLVPRLINSQCTGSASSCWLPPLPLKKFDVEQLKWNIELVPLELRSDSSSGPSGGFRSSSYSRSDERLVMQSSA